MASRSLVLLLAIAAASSACEMVAGIGDRKLATTGASGGNASGGQGGGGSPATAGGRTSAGGGSGSGGISAAGGATGNGGVTSLGGSTGSGATTSLGGTPSTGGVTADGGAGGFANPDGATNTGGAAGSGGASNNTGGSTRTGGTTGQGGTKTDGAVDAPLLLDAASCLTASPVGTGNGLEGDYFATRTLTSPVLSRIDTTINYDWAARAPDMGLPADGFSVRWTGQVQPRFTGRYTFTTNTDDGVRLWINGNLIIDDWNDHMATENTGVADLMAGQKYDLKMEYYEAGQLASAQLFWSSNCLAREIIPQSQIYSPAIACPAAVSGTGDGLVGQYFDNQDFTALRVTRTDPVVSFVWADGASPHPAIAAGSYSARWTGQVQASTSGFTTFYVVSEGGARLFINDALAVDNWTTHTRTEDMATIATVAGQTYDLRLEYFQQSGGGQIQLLWGGACQAKDIIPQSQLTTAYAGMVCTDPAPGTGSGLRGDYYNNPDFTSLATTHAAEAVNFDWGLNAPAPNVGADTFSVRWTGKLLARYTGGTTFRTWSDDGVRLWIDGKLIIDDIVDHQAAEDAGLAYLVAGQLHDIKLEFHENLENALIKLLWYSPCQPEETIPASQLFPPGYVPPDAGADAAPDTAADAGADINPAIDASVETEAGAID